MDAGDGTDTLLYNGTAARLIDFNGATSQIDPDIGVWLNFENLSAPTARGQLTVIASADTTAITAGKLRGDQISLTVGGTTYTGRVNGNQISGGNLSATKLN